MKQTKLQIILRKNNLQQVCERLLRRHVYSWKIDWTRLKRMSTNFTNLTKWQFDYFIVHCSKTKKNLIALIAHRDKAKKIWTYEAAPNCPEPKKGIPFDSLTGWLVVIRFMAQSSAVNWNSHGITSGSDLLLLFSLFSIDLKFERQTTWCSRP